MSEDSARKTENSVTEPVVDGAEPMESTHGEISELMAKLDEATAEAAQAREAHLRCLADLENVRRRAARERDEARRLAAAAVIEDFLPVLDNFSLGLQSAQAHEGGAVFAQGFAMILGQFRQLLSQHGVEEINPQGQPFDPNAHESISQVADARVPEGHVVSVQRVGYRMGERLLRAASVVVSSGPGSA